MRGGVLNYVFVLIVILLVYGCLKKIKENINQKQSDAIFRKQQRAAEQDSYKTTHKTSLSTQTYIPVKTMKQNGIQYIDDDEAFDDRWYYDTPIKKLENLEFQYWANKGERGVLFNFSIVEMDNLDHYMKWKVSQNISKQKAELRIFYETGDGHKTERNIIPYQIIDNHYLIAGCKKTNDSRTFVIDNISEIWDYKAGEIIRDKAVSEYFMRKKTLHSKIKSQPYLLPSERRKN